MSLWTPSGEHPVGDEGPEGPGAPPPPPSGPADDERRAAEAEVEELRRQLASAPASVVVANHCYGIFELAAVYLSESPPVLDQAKLAIDALGYLVEGLGSRLDEAEPALREALAQVRLAFVQIQAALEAAGPAPADGTEG